MVKKLLSKREKESLRYEQQLALEYAEKFSKLDEKKAAELTEAILELQIPRLKEKHAVKIVDILPEDANELKALFQKDSLNLTKDQIDKLVIVIGKYKK